MSDYTLCLRRQATHYPTSGEAFTLGEIFSPESDQSPYCYTVEDEIRDGVKVSGLTAIPEGLYELVVTFSNRFQKPLPLLKEVSGFSGVRVHGGNKAENSEGCVIVGANRTPAGVCNCADTVQKIIDLIESNKQIGLTTWLSIINTGKESE